MESKLQKCSSADSTSAPKLVLYSYWKSSCAWRVRFALRLKGLPYEYRAVNLAKGEQLTPEFEKLNPLKYVPVLVDDDVVVSDSYAILLYLEEKYPHIPLLPTDPQLRAINLQAASIVSSSIQPLRMLSLLKLLEEKVGPEKQLAWAQLHIKKGFLALEKLLKDYAGRYATGEKVYMLLKKLYYLIHAGFGSIEFVKWDDDRCFLPALQIWVSAIRTPADVFLAPEIAVATTGFNIDMSKFPVLNMIYEACNTLPEFQASLPDRQPDAEP